MTAYQIERWTFTATAGDAIRLRIASRENVSLNLRDDGGVLLGSGTEIALSIPADGTYTVDVELSDAERANYEMALVYTDRDNPFAATPCRKWSGCQRRRCALVNWAHSRRN